MRYTSLKDAIFQGFAPEGELYLPSQLPSFTLQQLKRLRGMSFVEVSYEIGKELFPDIPDLKAHLETAYDFPVPFLPFDDETFVLELFHGPTLSFKDFGARLLARLIRAYKKTEEPLTVLVATSGDTGSAVGNAFLDEPGVRVFILYPKGRVTASQQQQITTIGGNVTAIEVEGNFEACQAFVKQAVLELPNVTTGNSINVGRLLAHTLYYFYAYSQLKEHGKEALFAIPCGNFGHLVAGMLAKKMGLPVARFIGATNVNDEVPLFLHSGVFKPHAAYQTMAVSMDVGNPSNFPRLLELYDHSLEKLRRDLIGVSFTDEEVGQTIRQVFEKTGYLLDPHSAIGYMGLKQYLQIEKHGYPGIFFATAHPGKFREALEPIVGTTIPIPTSLSNTLSKPENAINCSNDYKKFKEIILSIV